MEGDGGERRVSRHEEHGGRSWVVGGVLILLGVIFLLQTYASVEIHNWWALFILIPAFTSFAAGWRTYPAAGRPVPAMVGSLFGGVIFVTLTVVLLLELDWGRVWPVFVIAAGLAVLAGAWRR